MSPGCAASRRPSKLTLDLPRPVDPPPRREPPHRAASRASPTSRTRMAAGVAHHPEPGPAAARMLPELGVRPGRVLAQVQVVVERLRPGVRRRPRQQLRRPATGELAQVALAAERAGQAHAAAPWSQTAARALTFTVRDTRTESEDAYPDRRRLPRRRCSRSAPAARAPPTRAATGGLGGAAVGPCSAARCSAPRPAPPAAPPSAPRPRRRLGDRLSAGWAGHRSPPRPAPARRRSAPSRAARRRGAARRSRSGARSTSPRPASP